MDQASGALHQEILEKGDPMTEQVAVTQLTGQSETSGASMLGQPGTGSAEFAVQVALSDAADSSVCGPSLGPQQLYSDVDDSLRFHVVNLLQRARSALLQALQYDPSSEFTRFDQEMMIARALLVRALNCREIGAGFTAVVNAATWAIANRDAGPLSKRQINAVIEALNRVLWSPYLHFDTAMSILDALEEVDLNIESPALELITAELDD